MPKSAQTELAILAALSLEPMTGYAVRDLVHARLGAFWSESFGQIYPTLARLRDEGFVELETGARTGSSVHRLTASGRARLLELLHEPVHTAPPRNGTLLRLFFGDLLGAEASRDLIGATRARAAAMLDELAIARAEVEVEPASDQRTYRLITISAGEHSARAAIAWADESLAALPTR